MTSRKPALAVVGATGAAGAVMLRILSQRADVRGEIRLLSPGPPAPLARGGGPSPRPADRRPTVRGVRTDVLPLDEDTLRGVDVAVFLAPEEVAARWAPIAAA
ncbi:hypothetical protein ACIRED_31390, partial [Streptomyces roseolilacinus]